MLSVCLPLLQVMAPTEPSKAVSSLLDTPRYKLRTQYYKGSLVEPQDLAAVRAEYADAILILLSRQVHML